MNAHLIISRSFDDGDAARFEDALARIAAQAGAQVLIVPDIYHTPHDSPLWERFAGRDGRIALATRHYPRAAEWVLRSHASGLGEVLAVDLRECPSAEDCWRAIAEWLTPVGEGSVREVADAIAERWYPVVDLSRCTGCGQCVQFCIFGVWALQDGHAVTVAPDNCKPGCPACARVCPHGAIIFALCDEPDIAGAPGAVIQPEPDSPDADIHAEIDALIDELDALAGEDRS